MPDPYRRARRHLARVDPVLGAIIARIGPCRLGHGRPEDAFTALVRAIASQQLSTRAADTIFGRFCALFDGGAPDAARAAALDDEAFRRAGFSRAKASFVRDLAARVADGRLDLEALPQASDEDAMRQLMAVKGIGRWTAEVFLMFRLKRPDVWPVDDLGLVKAVQRAYGMRRRPSPDRLRRLGEPWRPYRSVAAWYLWASLEE
ncbi:MAG: DNA-3-methyladenine glycosylase 2 family protein [Acidobacteriota bacterium]